MSCRFNKKANKYSFLQDYVEYTISYFKTNSNFKSYTEIFIYLECEFHIISLKSSYNFQSIGDINRRFIENKQMSRLYHRHKINITRKLFHQKNMNDRNYYHSYFSDEMTYMQSVYFITKINYLTHVSLQFQLQIKQFDRNNHIFLIFSTFIFQLIDERIQIQVKNKMNCIKISNNNMVNEISKGNFLT